MSKLSRDISILVTDISKSFDDVSKSPRGISKYDTRLSVSRYCYEVLITSNFKEVENWGLSTVYLP